MALQEFQTPSYSGVSLDYNPKATLIKDAVTVSKYGYAVTESTTPHSMKLATAGDIVTGIITLGMEFDAGASVPIACKVGDLAPAMAGTGGVTAGDPVKPESGGTWVNTVSAGDKVYGFAETSALVGEVFALRINPYTVQVSDLLYWTRSASKLYPSTDASVVQSGDDTADAACLGLSTNVIEALGTGATVDVVVSPKGATGALDLRGTAPEIKTTVGTNTNIKIVPNGSGAIDLGGSAPSILTSVGTNTDITIHPKGSGVVKMTNGSLTGIPLLPYIVATQGTTGTGGTIGRITVANMTSAAVIIATAAEALTLTALAYVVADAGFFTCYDNSNTAIDTKKINYIVLSL